MQRLQITPGGSLLAVIVILLLFGHALRHRNSAPLISEPAEDYIGEPRTDEWWDPLHKQLVEEATSTNLDVIFYGDSITESLRGTMSGRPNERMAANEKMFKKIFGKRPTSACGMAGDQTQHLLWRLHNGELSLEHPPRVAVILIGTNNLGHARIRAEGEDELIAIENAVPTITKHMLFILKTIHQKAPKTKVLLVGVLPRGGGGGGKLGMEQPSMYSTAIEEINQHYAEFASQDGRVEYVDCSEAFLTTTGNTVLIDKLKMPDGLHPEGEQGAKAMLECIAPAVDSLLKYVL